MHIYIAYHCILYLDNGLLHIVLYIVLCMIRVREGITLVHVTYCIVYYIGYYITYLSTYCITHFIAFSISSLVLVHDRLVHGLVRS